jgi:hypothetical protein
MFLFFNSLKILVICALLMGSAAANEGLPVAVPEASESVISENSNSPKILMSLAVRYEHAEGVPLDYSKAVALYCQAAKLGNADAQYALGWMYANGRGIPKDDGVATQLFTMAAEQGHAPARNMVRFTRSSTTTVLPSCLLADDKTELVKEEVEVVNEAGVAEENLMHSDKTAYLHGPIFKLVHQLAPSYEIDPKLVLAVISVESGFNVSARSPKNAQGLMQLIPETAQRFRVKNAFDPKENIKGGLAYLQWLLAFFKGNVPLVAAAYNAGEKAVEKYRGIPPYPETQEYVRKIAKLYKKTEHPYQRNVVEASSVAMLPMSLAKR